MKIDKKFKLRKIAGENIIVQQGQVGADLTKIISLNNTACFLYENFVDKDFSAEEAAQLLETTYQIEAERAFKDAAAWIEALKDCHVITD